MTKWCILCLLLSTLMGMCVAPIADRNEKKDADKMYDVEHLSEEDAQDKEYIRYMMRVIKVLERDPLYQKRVENLSEDEIKKGKLIDGMIPALTYDVKEKLNQLKKDEVEHQRSLLADNKKHMAGVERNEWNPIHHDDKETFTQSDLEHLLDRYTDIMAKTDEKRKQDFKEYEIKKELKHREEMKNKTENEEAGEGRKKKHEKMHQPGHKAQMEEVWAEQDGLDPDYFDAKTFFSLHDKNADGYWDTFELETLFLHDLDKVYDEKNPDTDPKEREEEMQRMREVATKEMDIDKDGLISYREYEKLTKHKKFNKDEEWDPLTETQQFTEKELDDLKAEIDALADLL